jgi:hypothetical protein
VILTCNYEELTALRAGADSYLESELPGGMRSASSDTRAAVESLRDRLTPSLSVGTLSEQNALEVAVRAIVEHFRAEMELFVLAGHPAAEQSVAAYFDFAHTLSVLGRLEGIRHEMGVLIEVITGGAPNEEAIKTFVFPD